VDALISISARERVAQAIARVRADRATTRLA
jgi:hypothetical protein